MVRRLLPAADQRRNRPGRAPRPAHSHATGESERPRPRRPFQQGFDTEEWPQVRREGLDAHPLQGLGVGEIVGRPPDRLGGVVDEDIEAGSTGQQAIGERHDRRQGPEVERFDPQPAGPGVEVRLPGVPGGGVPGETGRDEHLGPVPQQLQGGLIADLDPPAGDDRPTAGQLRPLPALLRVEPCAGRTEQVVVVVDLTISAVADVTAAGLRFQHARAGYFVGPPGKQPIRCGCGSHPAGPLDQIPVLLAPGFGAGLAAEPAGLPVEPGDQTFDTLPIRRCIGPVAQGLQDLEASRPLLLAKRRLAIAGDHATTFRLSSRSRQGRSESNRPPAGLWVRPLYR